jgi:2-oxoglutarate ferredoxin oxidoreductase subunit alpha
MIANGSPTMSNTALAENPSDPSLRENVESAVVRFAGDSGDGMQLTGGQFTLATAFAGNDLATFPDFPAEIRAPAGTTFGVSSFQINFGSRVIKTAGDAFDMLIAMNPAALKVELHGLKQGGVIIADTGSFNDRDLRKAGYDANPLEDGSLEGYHLVALDISKLTMEAVKDLGLTKQEASAARTCGRSASSIGCTTATGNRRRTG